MRMLAFASRNRKELTRDPLTLLFGVGFPVVLLILMTIINNSVSAATGVADTTPQFQMDNLMPGMMVFGLSFLSLFGGMLIAGDRDNSFLMRLFSSPLSAWDYIAGYALPIFLVALAQSIICIGVGVALGATLSWRLLLALVAVLPAAFLYVGFGLLLGSVFSYRQVGGVSSILINLAAWMSGTWFQLELIGGGFKAVCNILPFANAVDLVRKAFSGSGDVLANLLITLAWASAIFVLATVAFKKKMKQ